jgi:hypothetical protein
MLKDDEDKFRLILKMTSRLKDIEDEMKQISSSQGAMMFGNSSSSTAFYNTNNICNDSYFLNPPQLINFKPIKDNQMVNSQVPT